MWSPTHIQVTVLGAKGLLTKGKNGTNNCFVTIALGKEKFATSIKEKAVTNVDWREECELTIPERGNRAELILTCLHRNNIGMDEFLGQVTLPLNEMDAYERPRSRWYKLQSKPGKEKKKERGELEVRIAFTVKAGSLTDLSKKEKHKTSTLGIGGSLLSLGTLEKRKGLKKFAKSLGSKVHITGKKKDKDNDSISGSVSSLSTPGSGQFQERRYASGQAFGDADPGVISEDDDEFAFDNISNKSSASSINLKTRFNHPNLPTPPSPLATHSNSSTLEKQKTNTNPFEDENVKLRANSTPTKPPRNIANPSEVVDEWETKLYGKHDTSTDSLKRRSWDTRVPLNKEESSINETPERPKSIEETSSEAIEQREKPMPTPRSSAALIEESVATPITSIEKEKKEKSEKRFANKLKYFRKDKTEANEEARANKHTDGINGIGGQQRQFNGERIIIGHENEMMLNNGVRKQIEVPQELLKKYEGKSREEIMVLANDYENEIKMQKLKIKEMEDYLDDLLLRVMETQPKILQNPYRTQTSAKSG